MRVLLMAILAGAVLVAPAREADDRYRQVLAAIAWHGFTIGVPREGALAPEGGFQPFFLGMNACTRHDLGAPFAPATELMLITSVHGGRILGLTYRVHGDDAAVAALRDRIAAITGLALALDADGVEQDGVFLRWRTLTEEGQEPGREFTVYDIRLHDELRAAATPAK